jgi:hypothetical protein
MVNQNKTDMDKRIMVSRGEDGFRSALVEIIRISGIDPEIAPSLADEIYRHKFDLPMDVVYSQFLG